MQALERGRYRARPAETRADKHKAKMFRNRCFGLQDTSGADHLDEACGHIVIEERATGETLCYFRITLLPAEQLNRSYAAQFYDLAALETVEGPLMEVGRFCVNSARKDPDVLRLAWAAVTALVDRHDVKMLFGCSSFQGNEPERYTEAFAFLKTHHLAPRHCAPKAKAAETYDFTRNGAALRSTGLALRQMPPLLRSYLSMGAWVSDHAVIDRALNTLHVFTGLEVDAVPPGRKRLLRAI